MKSVPRTLLPLSLMLAVTGCTASIIRADRTPCSQLVPDGLKADTPDQDAPAAAVPLPAGATWEARFADALAQLKDWTGFAVRERADKRAEQRSKAAIVQLHERCEARDAAAVKRARGGLFR